MAQTPRFVWQVSTDRILTASRVSSIAFAACSSISLSALTINRIVNGSWTSSAATLPRTRSRSEI